MQLANTNNKFGKLNPNQNKLIIPIQVPKHQLHTQGLIIQSSLNGNPLYK